MLIIRAEINIYYLIFIELLFYNDYFDAFVLDFDIGRYYDIINSISLLIRRIDMDHVDNKI